MSIFHYLRNKFGCKKTVFSGGDRFFRNLSSLNSSINIVLGSLNLGSTPTTLGLTEFLVEFNCRRGTSVLTPSWLTARQSGDKSPSWTPPDIILPLRNRNLKVWSTIETWCFGTMYIKSLDKKGHPHPNFCYSSFSLETSFFLRLQRVVV